MPSQDTVNQFGDTPQSSAPCPLFSPSDYLQLLQLEHQAALGNQGAEAYLLALQLSQRSQRVTVIGRPLDQTDLFRFRAFGTGTATVVSFYGRTESPNGNIVPFLYNLPTDTAGTVFSVQPTTGPGWLLEAAASVPLNSITFGNVTAVGEIGRLVGGSFVPHTLLFSGQLDGNTPLTTVNPPPQVPLARVDNLIFNDVPGGTTVYAHTVTPTPGRRMRFTRVGFLWTSSATAGTRFPTIAFRSNGNSFWQGESSLSRGAGTSGSYNFNLETLPATSGSLYLGLLPATLYFYQPISVEIIDGSSTVVSGDAVTSVFIRWEES